MQLWRREWVGAIPKNCVIFLIKSALKVCPKKVPLHSMAENIF
jgi:hypothetical protein